jgi:DNA-binding phage protein
MSQLAANPTHLDARHVIFLSIIRALGRAHLPTVAKHSNVSPSTLYNWLYGDTQSPNSRTLFSVAETLGFRITFSRGKQTPKLTRVK